MQKVATRARARAEPGLPDGMLQRLCMALRGEVLQPGNAGYDPARRLWNGAIDRRPAAILRCTGTADVVAAVAAARGSGLPLAVRAGGHSLGGLSSCDGGLVIDLSPMRAIEVDPERRIVRAEAGVLLAELDAATQAHGLAAATGVVGHTGIAGLTLGGGMGRLMRKYGLTCDTLLSAEVVLADGRVVTASATEHPDLFWGLRGGGGNFGVVTRFELRVFPVGPTILGGMVLHDIARAAEGLRFYRDFCLAAPDELSVDAALLALPEGGQALAFSACHIGPPEQAARDLAPLRAFGPPAQDMIGPMPYAALQTGLDDLFAYGRRFYWKSHFLRDMPDALIDVMVAEFARVPAAPSVIILQQAGGAGARRDAADAPYANRDANWNFIPCAIWEDPAEDARNRAWARGVFEATRGFGSGGVYVNDLGEEGEERIRAAYGGNYARLARVKAQYDPGNLFRLNQNIRPAA